MSHRERAPHVMPPSLHGVGADGIPSVAHLYEITPVTRSEFLAEVRLQEWKETCCSGIALTGRADARPEGDDHEIQKDACARNRRSRYRNRHLR